MSKREEFIAFLKTLKTASPTITAEQRKGFLRLGVQQHGLTVEEATDIFNASGIGIGERVNYFEVLGFSIAEIQNLNDTTSVSRVAAAHKSLYSASLKAGGRPRADGRTEEQWRTVLNQARDTLIDPQRRHEHAAMFQQTEAEALPEENLSPPPELTEAEELNHQIVTPNIDAPPDMAFIPAGNFQMGSDDPAANEDEHPVHTVSLDAFFIDKYLVTNTQFKEFVDANPQWHKRRWFKDHIPSAYHDGGYLKHWEDETYPNGKGEHPVVNVSWYAAMAYAQWKGKRLPTEAEWEKAARGGLKGKKYPWGDSISADDANYFYYVGDTTPVGHYPANRYGLHDMSGNVWEWCLDSYHAYFYVNSSPQNPFSAIDSVAWITRNFESVKSTRVLRGGSWGIDVQGVRCAYRFKGNPTYTLPTFGFRCVKDIQS